MRGKWQSACTRAGPAGWVRVGGCGGRSMRKSKGGDSSQKEQVNPLFAAEKKHVSCIRSSSALCSAARISLHGERQADAWLWSGRC